LSSRGRWVLGCTGLAALAACHGGGEASPPPSGCFSGDATAAPLLALVRQAADGGLAPVTDGDMVPLVVPPQGGEVLLIGVRALNIDGCPLTMSTSLVLSTGVVAAFERRPVNLRLAEDGWLQPASPSGLANFANLPACPIAGLGQSIDGVSSQLVVDVEDRAGRRGHAAATILPTCEGDATSGHCRCLCAAGYVLGDVCP